MTYKFVACIEALLLLFIAFLILKVCEVVSWTWLWVSAPLWMPASFAALFAVSAFGLVYLYRHQDD